MTALLSSVFLVLWATAAAPGALVSAFNVSTGFSDDTININTVTLTLSATCLNSDGRNTSSTIPLDSCIGNDNGQLTTGTNFSQSCENTYLLWNGGDSKGSLETVCFPNQTRTPTSTRAAGSLPQVGMREVEISTEYGNGI
ncbi:hypothetical protein K438DRAFT_1768316 [Mycena galopus ATCC 62051]|nr:hypothetical protein K438DRAFT_1768316 [Mycena galopus ATCC 62051]